MKTLIVILALTSILANPFGRCDNYLSHWLSDFAEWSAWLNELTADSAAQNGLVQRDIDMMQLYIDDMTYQSAEYTQCRAWNLAWKSR